MTPTGKTDSEGHVYYELEIGEFYRDQLLRAGISYNIQVYVEVTYFGGGSINVAPDKLSQCMDTDKWLLLGVTRTVEANDNELHVVYNGARGNLPDLLSSLVTGGVRLSEFREDHADLEEVFLSVTHRN